MSDSLDDKLRELLDLVWCAALDYSSSPDLRNQQGVLDEEKYLEAKNNTKSYSIAQIKQAFSEAGYLQIPQVEIVTRYERGEKPELFMVNGKEVMTGQEWYERFKKQYHMSADWIAGDPEMGDEAEHDVLSAAKRAAGLDT